ncbi:MAG: ABC transporter permease subunit [SAR324 cluster bacterium]|nr:ABC transporter permease subunit [SAR324 cluster bacterium]
MIKSMVAIASTTLLSWIRDKTFYAIVLIGGLVVLCSLFLNEMIVGEKVKVINDLGLSVTLLFGVFMTLFTTIPANQDKTLYMVLSRPIARYYWILGNYLGNSLILLINTLTLSLLMLTLVKISGFDWNPDMNWALLLIYMETLIILAVSTCFSTLMTSVTLSRFCTLSVFVVGHLLETVKILMEANNNVFLKNLFQGMYYLFPNFAAFDIKTEAVHHLPVDSGHLFYAVAYGIAYIIILLIVSAWRFSRTDV